MKTTWTLVADEAIARILEQPDEGGDLVPVEELTDPDAHAREAEMRHDAHGRRAGGATVSAADSERHQHAQAFAARIAERLAQCLQQRRCESLHVIAAPRLLGYLRKAFSANVTAAVASEQDKDVVQESLADLTRRIPNLARGLS
ncbi:host attachment protein [Roseateles sp. P5_E7]